MKPSAMKRRLHLLFVLGCAALPLPAAELVTVRGATLVEADLNDGDSFRVDADGRELHLRLYYVDCPETASGDRAILERIREQQRHFGLEDPVIVTQFGERAAEYVKRALSRPFTVHTSYARAPGRSASGRFYAFVETHDGRDLGHLLVERGLARVYGKTRPAPDGTPSQIVIAELEDLRDGAMLKRAGIWQATNPDLLAELRRRQREDDRELVEFRDSVMEARTRDDEPLDLNGASGRELQRLPGIGPVSAAKIVAGRPYRAVEDLLKIPGIGAKTLEGLKGYVRIGGE